MLTCQPETNRRGLGSLAARFRSRVVAGAWWRPFTLPLRTRDAKAIKGRVRIARPLFQAERLLISGRNHTKLIDGLDRQVAVVRLALDAGGHQGVPVQGVLCFTKAELPLLGTLKMRGHLLLHRKALARRLNGAGPLEPTTMMPSPACL